MENVIKELKTKKNIAFDKAKEGDAYHTGAYKAFHIAIELIKRAERNKDKVMP